MGFALINLSGRPTAASSRFQPVVRFGLGCRSTQGIQSDRLRSWWVTGLSEPTAAPLGSRGWLQENRA